MDCSTISSAISALTSIATACAALFGVYVAFSGIKKWHVETVGKRRIELAEDVLAGFYQARDVIQAIRSPMGFSHEVADRQRAPQETGEEKIARDAAFRTLYRYEKQQQMFNELRAKQYRMKAVFGNDGAGPFDNLYRIVAEIIAAAQTLLRMDIPTGSHDAAQIHQRFQEIIWSDMPGDRLTARIDAAVASMEAVCRSAINNKPQKPLNQGAFHRIMEGRVELVPEPSAE